MDQSLRFFYTCGMSNSEAGAAPAQRKAFGLRTLLSNPGMFFLTLFKGKYVGADALGNQYYERPGKHRSRRWVIYAGPTEASVIGPEWHAWLHHLTDAPLPASGAKPWQRPHKANLTGTPASYRPSGHDYMGGNRAKASADYEAWSPDQA